MISQFNCILDKYIEETNKYNKERRKCYNNSFRIINKIITYLNWPKEKTFYAFLIDQSKGFVDGNIKTVNYEYGNTYGIDQIDLDKVVTFSSNNFWQVYLCLELSELTTSDTAFYDLVKLNFIVSVLIKEKDNEIEVQTSVTEKPFTFINSEIDYSQDLVDISEAIANKIKCRFNNFYAMKQNQERYINI